MASAKKTTVKETKTTVVDVERVVLELSTEEAQFLTDVLGAIGGSPVTTRRKHQQPISSALRNAGFYCGAEDKYGSITFQ